MADNIKKYLGADGIAKLHELVDEAYQKKDDMPEYTLAKQNSAESGYFATYYLEKDGEQIGVKINIPKDYLVKHSEGVKTAEEDDPSGFPEGTKYIDLVINAYDESATDTHLYINVADLVDVITAGNGINVSDNNEISAKVVNQNGLSVSASGITMSLVTQSAAGAMSAADKEKLDGIEDGAEVNVIEIVKVNGDALTPSNKAVDITVPTGDLADLDEVAESNLTDELAEKINGKQDELSFDGTYNPSTNKVATESTVTEAIEEVSGDIPTALSELSQDATHRTVTDTEKATWDAKSDFSGSYNDLTEQPTIPDELADLASDSTHRTVTDTEKTAWSSKYTKPSGGIPASDLSSDVQSSLDNADSALEGLSGKVDKITGKGLSTNDYTTAEKNKLAGIAAGAEVNVNADWNASSGDAQILNKPTIPSQLSQLTGDATHRTVTDTEKTTWNNKSEFSGNYNDLTNKPTIPSQYILPAATSSALGGIKAAAKTSAETVEAKIGSDSKIYVPAGGALRLIPLWENASPTSSFAAQTVSFDLSAYNHILVFFGWATGEPNTETCMINRVGKTTRISWIHGSKLLRDFKSDATGVEFMNAAKEGNMDNTVVIPLRVYGIVEA